MSSHPCPACGQPVERRHERGRPPRFCNPSCKTTFYRREREARQAREIARAVELLRAKSASDALLSDD